MPVDRLQITKEIHFSGCTHEEVVAMAAMGWFEGGRVVITPSTFNDTMVDDVDEILTNDIYGISGIYITENICVCVWSKTTSADCTVFVS